MAKRRHGARPARRFTVQATGTRIAQPPKALPGPTAQLIRRPPTNERRASADQEAPQEADDASHSTHNPSRPRVAAGHELDRERDGSTEPVLRGPADASGAISQRAGLGIQPRWGRGNPLRR